MLSIEVLSGLTIALMILVKDPGDGSHTYSQLDHGTWNDSIGNKPVPCHNSTEITSLAVALTYIGVCLLPNWLLWRRKSSSKFSFAKLLSKIVCQGPKRLISFNLKGINLA